MLGVPVQAEIIPIEPDADNAVEGKGIKLFLTVELLPL